MVLSWFRIITSDFLIWLNACVDSLGVLSNDWTFEYTLSIINLLTLFNLIVKVKGNCKVLFLAFWLDGLSKKLIIFGALKKLNIATATSTTTKLVTSQESDKNDKC